MYRFALFALVLVAACTDDEMTRPEIPLTNETENEFGYDSVKYVNGFKIVAIDGKEYVSIGDGTPLPRDVPMPAPPEPYNPAKHDPLIMKNTMPEANLMLRPGFKPPLKEPLDKIETDHETAQAAERGVAWWKLFRVSDDMVGFPPSNSRAKKFRFDRFPIADIIPSTILPPGNACIEASVAHNPYGDYHGFFDHCAASPDWLILEDMNESWVDRYTVLSSDNERHISELIKRLAPDCWQGYLLNVDENAFELKTPTICGSSGRSYGWTGWESRYFMEEMNGPDDCPDVHSIFQYMNLDGIDLINLEREEINHGICFTSGYYDIREWPTSGGRLKWSWVAETPNPKNHN